MHSENVSRTEIGVLKIGKKMPTCRNPNDTNALPQSKWLSTKAELKGSVSQKWHFTCTMLKNYEPNGENANTE